MAQIEVRGLGANEIRIGRRRITPATEVVFALAFYLCVRAGERLTRDEVMELFWGTGDVTKGRHSLRQMLYKLRQRGFELDEDGEELYLDPSRLVSDVADALHDSWSDDASVASLETSLDLVPALTKGVSSRFHEWLDSLRGRLGAQHRRAAIRHLHQARREGRWADLDRIALLMLRTDPLNEEATLARAESAAMIGSKALALEILDQYVEELGDKATKIGLPATVLRRRISERATDWRHSEIVDAPLQGRELEVGTLVRLLDRAARGEGCSALLSGAGGAGKTRLISEVSSFAALNGFSFVSVKAQANDSTNPLSTVLALCRCMIDAAGAGGAHPAAFALLRRISESTAHSPDSSIASAPGIDFESLSWALVEVLGAISNERKLVLSIDDLHKAHDASISLIARLFTATRDLRVLWLVAARPEEAGSRISPSLATVTIRVGPLAMQPALALATHYLERSGKKLFRSAPEVVKLAGGSPFFIRETAIHLSRRNRLDSTPDSLVELMHQRISRLGSVDLSVLRASHLMGTQSTVGRLSRVIGRDPFVLSECIERLELECMLSFAPSKRVELHDCWNSVVAQHWSHASRASLALRTAQVLDEDYQQGPSLELARTAGALYRESGELEHAARMFEAAADETISSGLYGESRVYLSECIGCTKNPERRSRALSRRAVALHALGDYLLATQDCDLALQTQGTSAASTRTAHTIAYGVLTDSLWRLGRDNRAALHQLAEYARDPAVDPSVRHHACLMGLRALFSVRDSDFADHFEKIARAETARSGSTVYGELCALIFAAERGDIEGVYSADARLQDFSAEMVSPAVAMHAFQNRISALRVIGDTRLAVERVEYAIRLCEEHGLVDLLAASLLKRCYLALDSCDVENARVSLDRVSSLPFATRSEQNQREFNHAKSRLLLQTGDAEGSLEVYGDDLEAVRSDTSDRRRAIVASTIALASALSGRLSQAEDMLRVSMSAIAGDQPGRFADYSTELCSRTLLLLGRHDEAESMLKSCAETRRRLRDGGPVKFLSCLRSALQNLDSVEGVNTGLPSEVSMGGVACKNGVQAQGASSPAAGATRDLRPTTRGSV